MSKTNNRRLRAQILDLKAQVKELTDTCIVLEWGVQCAYCGEVLLREYDELMAHSKVCPKHPCRS